MDYNHPFFSSEDISIPIPNPGQHPSAPIQMLRRENYHPLHESMNNSMMALSNYAQAPSISPVEDAEELDTSSRPRLTQEQIATLEDNFKERPKPGTDFKKHLASQIGLSLQRVNVSPERKIAMLLADNSNRIGIKIVAQKPGTRSPRREASMFYQLSLALTGGPRIFRFRTIKMAKIITRSCRSKSQQATSLVSPTMAC